MDLVEVVIPKGATARMTPKMRAALRAAQQYGSKYGVDVKLVEFDMTVGGLPGTGTVPPGRGTGKG